MRALPFPLPFPLPFSLRFALLLCALFVSSLITNKLGIFAIFGGTTFGLWREQIRLNRIVIKTCFRCGQNYFVRLCWLAFLARCARLTLTSFSGFAWFALGFGLALVSCLFRFACFFGFFRLALLLGSLGFCACTFFLLVATATAATTATTGAATAIVAFT